MARGEGDNPLMDPLPVAAELTPVFVPKASDVLAAQLREHILGGALAEGTPLPAEREICAQSGLSRASVREALRTLEVEGLILTRPGRNGGTVVRRPGHDALSRSLGLFVRSHGIRLQALLEAREAIEPAAARFAARNRTDADIARIVDAQTRLERVIGDIDAYVRANLDWHLAVVQASGNEPLIAFMTAIAQSIHAATDRPDINTDEVRTAVTRAHRRVLDAIVAQDVDAAYRRMQRHVGAYAEVARAMADG